MKVYQTNEIKNIALLGSSGSGKTTLVEAMLFESGFPRARTSQQGNVLDFISLIYFHNTQDLNNYLV